MSNVVQRMPDDVDVYI